MLDDISKLHTWKCVRIQLQAPADRPAESEPINTQEQQTGLAPKGNLPERYRKHWERQQRYATAMTRREMPGMLREALGNASNATLLPRHAGNAQPMKPEP